MFSVTELSWDNGTIEKDIRFRAFPIFIILIGSIYICLGIFDYALFPSTFHCC